MSFEGFYRVLCRQGHVHSADCGYCGFNEPCFTAEEQTPDSDELPPRPLWKCVDCGEVAGWWDLVDQTNGYDEQSEVKLVEVAPAVLETCNLGYHHITTPARFRPEQPEEGHVVNGGLK